MKRILFVFLVMVGIGNGVAVAQIPSSERAVLINLYNSTNGPGWANQMNWNGPAGTECTWYGITCDGDSVSRIYLENNQLAGSLPELTGLTSLTILTLSSNQLTGSIPDLTGLTNLSSLRLYNNQLTGSIPELTGLTNLEGLYLSDNQLTGSIPELTGLTNLINLQLHNNQLTGSIPELTDLISLFALNLSNNHLTGSIPELTGLTKLQWFYLNNNQLTGLIPELTGLTSLRSLYLYDNQLTGSIPELSGLTYLNILYLHNNQLTGSIPGLTELTNLQILFLSSNQLTGSIPDLAGLTNLQALSLSDNQLTGAIPELTGLTRLQDCALYNNQLTGSIPDLTGLTSLQTLFLSNNQLTGSIPELTTLTSLQRFYLSNNQLTGSIPELSGLTKLEYLRFSDNQLTGPIPELTGLTSLEWIRVQDNQLTGTIPAAPPGLLAGNSSLCPNYLTPSIDPAWDAATGVTPWSAACTAKPGSPTINTGGVVGLNNVANTIQAGSWISIYGTDLASAASEWVGEFPTTLVGTSVTINGKAGYLWYVSPLQINLQAPDDDALGPVEVIVTTVAGTAQATVSLAEASPSFNLLDGTHIAGIIVRSDGTGAYGGGAYDIVGPTGSALGYPTVAAKAGDTLSLFGVGFGPTDPPVPAGREFIGAATAVYPVQLIINGQMVIPDWVGISAAGLFQLNLTVPFGLGAGDQPIQALVNGVSSPIGVVLSLQ